jgi:hypothetical protein
VLEKNAKEVDDVNMYNNLLLLVRLCWDGCFTIVKSFRILNKYYVRTTSASS